MGCWGTPGAGGRPSGLGICEGAWAWGSYLPFCARWGAFGPSGTPQRGGGRGRGRRGFFLRDLFFHARHLFLQGTQAPLHELVPADREGRAARGYQGRTGRRRAYVGHGPQLRVKVELPGTQNCRVRKLQGTQAAGYAGAVILG